MEYRWNAEKDAWLRAERGVGFEELVDAIESGAVVDDKDHPSPGRRHQRLLWVEFRGQIWILPYVVEGKGRFLKTAYPSRQARKKKQKGGDHETN